MHYEKSTSKHVYSLDKSAPTKTDADTFGMVLFFHPKVGWTCEMWDDAAYFKSEGFTCWSHTQNIPKLIFNSPTQSSIAKPNLIEN